MKNYLMDSNPMFAFNIWSFESAKAIIDAAGEIKKPVILQTSSSIYKDIDHNQLKEYIRSYSNQREVKAWLHLDHCKDIMTIKDAIQCGWDSVMIDASATRIHENIETTKQVVQLAHENNVLVEAEIGQVNGVEDDIDVSESLVASRDDIKLFVDSVDVDMLAVAFGNAHGMYKGSPTLDYQLVEFTTSITDIPFVVHGGSGLPDEILREILNIKGVKKINISTEVKMAYREGLLRALREGLFDELVFQPIKVEKMTHDAIVDWAKKKLQLLDN